MKTTLLDWIDGVVQEMIAHRESVDRVIAALGGGRPRKATKRGPYKKKAAKPKQVHWSKKPGVDPKKVKAWKEMMRQLNLRRHGG